jgi:large subunit ribosomal protein L25
MEGIVPLDDPGRTIVTIRPPKGADFLENLVAGIQDDAEEEVVAEDEELAEGEVAEGEEAPEGEEGEDDSEQSKEE